MISFVLSLLLSSAIFYASRLPTPTRNNVVIDPRIHDFLRTVITAVSLVLQSNYNFARYKSDKSFISGMSLLLASITEMKVFEI